MKTKVALLIAILFTMTTSMALAGPMPSQFSGKSEQFSGANLAKGNLQFNKNDFYKNGSGSQASGEQSSMAKYKGTAGNGTALAIGATALIADKFSYNFLGLQGKGFYVAGLTGSLSAACVTPGYGGPNFASISGSGNLGTFSAIQTNFALAMASSAGKYAYEGSVYGGGNITGYGLTVGGSVTGAGANNAFAGSSQFTTSGISPPNSGPY